MATDITIYIEKWDSEKERWVFIGCDDDIHGKFLMRNYTLFGILANETKDFTLIAHDTTRGVIPIVSPRGIPLDADKKEGYKDTDFKKDPYQRWYPSYVTLKEILDYPHWDKYLIIDSEHHKESYRDRCPEFINEFIPKLMKLTDNPEHLRIIYDFW